MKSLLAHRLACALAILPLVLLSDSRCFLTSAHSLQVIGRHHWQQDPVLGEKVSAFDGRVSFSPPAGFVKMTDDLIAKKFPDVKVPNVAYAGPGAAVSVAVGFADEMNFRPEELPEFQKFMIELLERTAPGMRWLTKEFVEFDGRRWIHLEYISRREGSNEVHNNLYLTSLENHLLYFNFNAVPREYEKSKAALQRSKETIVVKKPVNP